MHDIVLGAVLLAALFLFACVPVHAQSPAESPAATASIQPSTLHIDAATPAEFSVTVTPPPGHHAYLDAGKAGMLLPISINLDTLTQAGLQVHPVSTPKGEWDAQFNATLLRSAGMFRYRLTAASKVAEGTRDYSITVRSQVCSDANGACFFPHTTTLHLRVMVGKKALQTASGSVTPRDTSLPHHPAATSVTVDKASTAPTVDPAPTAPTNAQASTAPANDTVSTVPADTGGTPRQPSTATAAGTAPHSDVAQYTPRTNRPGHGLLVWILLAFVAGLLMNFMPCVLPVVSIKVLSFVQQAGESRRHMLGMGLVFAAGMLTVFLALAGAAILFGLGWGQQFQSQAFLIILIALVFAFALSLFGVYEFAMPTSVCSLAAHAHHEGYASVYLKGVLATLLATPCSGPLLGGTLAWTLTQSPSIVLLMFGMLGLGMALPYVVLTAHPALLKHLPKPGAWMETFKQVMGFMLIGTVAYLMVSLDPQKLLMTVILLVFVAFAAWIWGHFSLHRQSAIGGVLVLGSALLTVAFGAYFAFHTLRSVAQPTVAAVTPASTLAWEPFDPVKLAEYQREGRSVMLDFTADWCANCTFNEVRVYNSSAVRQLLREKHVVVMKADLTREGATTQTIRQLMGQLGARSIPFLAVFPGDQPNKPYTLYDLVDKEHVRNVLLQLPTDRISEK